MCSLSRSKFFVLPCCPFDFFGKFQRRLNKTTIYREYLVIYFWSNCWIWNICTLGTIGTVTGKSCPWTVVSRTLFRQIFGTAENRTGWEAMCPPPRKFTFSRNSLVHPQKVKLDAQPFKLAVGTIKTKLVPPVPSLCNYSYSNWLWCFKSFHC